MFTVTVTIKNMSDDRLTLLEDCLSHHEELSSFTDDSFDLQVFDVECLEDAVDRAWAIMDHVGLYDDTVNIV